MKYKKEIVMFKSKYCISLLTKRGTFCCRILGLFIRGEDGVYSKAIDPYFFRSTDFKARWKILTPIFSLIEDEVVSILNTDSSSLEVILRDLTNGVGTLICAISDDLGDLILEIFLLKDLVTGLSHKYPRHGSGSPVTPKDILKIFEDIKVFSNLDNRNLRYLANRLRSIRVSIEL